MMASQYDNDTALHYVSTLVVGMSRKHSVRLFPDEKLAEEGKTCTTLEFKEMSKLSFKNAVCRMMGQCLHVWTCFVFFVCVNVHICLLIDGGDER